MLYSSVHDLEDRIVEHLSGRRTSIKLLHQELSSEGPLSERAVYKAIDKLLGAEVLIKAGKQVMVNREWAAKTRESLGFGAPITLAPGERAVYSFISLENLDTFWKTVSIPLEEFLAAKEIFFYNPHNFWEYLQDRRESEEAYYQHFGPKRAGYLVIGGESKMDLSSKRRRQNEYFQINLDVLSSFRRNEHVAVIGPYITVTRLSASFAKQIDALYATAGEEALFSQELQRICSKPGKIRLLIEHNPKKAAKLRRTLARNFYFKRPE